jgi:cardiolipin synthase
LAGCQVTAAGFASDTGGAPARRLALVRQVAADSCLRTARRPLRSGWEWLHETTTTLCCFTRGEIGKRCLAVSPPHDAPGLHRQVLDGGNLEDELHDLSGTPLQPAQVRLFANGDEALTALEAVIDAARDRLDVLMFEWESDAVGRRIAERVAARAAQGVRVRVLVDGGGNLVFGEPDHASPASLNHTIGALAAWPYAQVRRTRNPYARFDHRKLVVADGCLAWTGGRNLVDKAFSEHRDLSFTLDGPLAAELAGRFEAFWREQDGPGDRNAKRSVGQPARCELHASNAWARLLHTEPTDHLMQAALGRVLDRAHHHVYVENVYLTDGLLVSKLMRARRRGADVRVVLTVEGNSVPINRANRVTANRLLQAGVRVYLYPGMTHAKILTVDGCWAYLGTGNLDPLSLRHNHEIGLAIAAGPVIEALEEGFLRPSFRPEWELREPLPASAGDYLCELVAAFCL